MKVYYDNSGTPTEVTGIIKWPEITTRNNSYGLCTVELVDFEGALYSTWESRDLTKMYVTDGTGTADYSNENQIFVGYLVNKIYEHNKCTLIIAGFGFLLERKPFNHNFILEEGKVKTVPYAGTEQDEIIRPNSDVDDGAWVGGDLSGTLDDNKTQPEAGGGDTITCASTSTCILNMGTFAFNDGVVCTSITAWVYGKPGNFDAYTVSYSIGAGDAATFKSPEQDPVGMQWGDVEWTGLELTNDDIDSIRFHLKNTSSGAGNSEVDVVYFVISTENKYALELKYIDDNGDDQDFAWGDDYWANDYTDRGILIVDNTGNVSSTIWTCTAVEDNGTFGTEVGDHTGLSAIGDGTGWYLQQNNDTDFTGCIGDLTIGGNNIPTSSYIKEIHVNFRFGVKANSSLLHATTAKATLQVYDGSDWHEVGSATSYQDWLGGTQPYSWVGEGDGTASEWEYDFKLPFTASTDLDDFLVVDGANYDEMQGVRIILTGGTNTIGYGAIHLDFCEVVVHHYTQDISPIMDKIDDNGDTWIVSSGTEWATTGVAANDDFKFGIPTTEVVGYISADSGLAVVVDSTFTRYVAQWFKGTYCLDAIKTVCDLEGCVWIEDHEDECIRILKPTDFSDSTVDLTSSDYEWNWKFEDKCNAVRRVDVFGNAATRIHASAEDIDVDINGLYKQIIDEKIATKPDAQEIADEQLALYNTKQPSIMLTMDGINSAITLGTTVDITQVRPTIAETTRKVRMIRRAKKGITGYQTTVWFGLGSTAWDEKILDEINRAINTAHKAHTDRLISTPIGESATITWSDIGGATAGARSACIEDDVYGAGWNADTSHAPTQNAVYDKIDAMDTTIATKQTQAQVEVIINAELVDGQSIDNAIDTLIATHHLAGSADHDDRYYTEAEIDVHASDEDAHHGVYDRFECQMIPLNGGAWQNDFIRLDGVGDDVSLHFYIGSYMDASTDIIVTFTHQTTSADATVDAKWYLSACKTDGTETPSWNVENGTATTLDSTTASKAYKTHYTFANADFDQGDTIRMRLRLNEASRTLDIYSISVLYKRSDS